MKENLPTIFLNLLFLLFSFSVERIVMFDNSYEREEKEISIKKRSFPVRMCNKSYQILFKYE